MKSSLCAKMSKSSLVPNPTFVGAGPITWTTVGLVASGYAADAYGFLTGTIDQNTQFDSTDFRNNVPRFAAEARVALVKLHIEAALDEFVRGGQSCHAASNDDDPLSHALPL